LTASPGATTEAARRDPAARPREAIMHRIDQLADLPCFRDQLETA
jgi:hypothetical protein